MRDTRVGSRIGNAAAVAAMIALEISGCTPSEQEDVSDGDGAAAQFVACLRAGGVEAKISDEMSGDAHVIVKVGDPVSAEGSSVSSDSQGGGEMPLVMMADSEGPWVAAESSDYFADDPDTQDTYAECEEAHADFAQPEFDPAGDPAVKEQIAAQQTAALEFAQCARDEGFAWVADPSPDSPGAIALPADLTEAEFRAVMTACWESEGAGLGWTMPADELDFDWQAVLMEFMDGAAGTSVTRDDG